MSRARLTPEQDRAVQQAFLERQAAALAAEEAATAEVDRLYLEAQAQGRPTTHGAILRVLAKRRAAEAAERRHCDDEAAEAVATPRKPGRPVGRRLHPKAAIVARFRELRGENGGRRPTQRELCDNLEPNIGLRTLQECLAKYGLPWPIE